MRDLLHDQKDALQEVHEKWRGRMESVKESMAKLIANADDPRDVFHAVNEIAADELASLTTEAARSGYAFGKKKVAGPPLK